MKNTNLFRNVPVWWRKTFIYMK